MENKYISKRINIDNLITMLQKALNAEFYASHLYWLAAHSVEGHEGGKLRYIFEELSKQEFEHAQKLIKRLNQLCADIEINIPTISFKDKGSLHVLDQILKSEDEAMTLYYDIIQLTENKDHITCALATELMAGEAEHESILKSFHKDIEHVRERTIEWSR